MQITMYKHDDMIDDVKSQDCKIDHEIKFEVKIEIVTLFSL